MFSAYRPEEEEEKRYDGTIQIASEQGEACVFPPDVTELHAARKQNGREHRHAVRAYKLADRPLRGDKRLAPSGEGGSVQRRCSFYKPIKNKHGLAKNCLGSVLVFVRTRSKLSKCGEEILGGIFQGGLDVAPGLC